ncbi:MAG: YHS domain-containing (seleno)protein [Acidiferrobacterales bacterium]
MMRKSLLLLIGLLVIAPAHAKPPVFETRHGAIRGYDPVAYFTKGKPVKGSQQYSLEWNGAKWYFASAENRDRFKVNPTQYAPQYGGYCAYAVANGYTATTDPNAWTLVDDKLYLNYSLGVRDKWSEDIPGNIVRGNKNWPSVLK